MKKENSCQYIDVKNYVRNSKERKQIIVLMETSTVVAVKCSLFVIKTTVHAVAYAFE